MNAPLSLSKRVILRPYVPRELIPYELASDAEILANVGNVLTCDTETFPNYFLIAMRDIKTKKVIKFEINAITGECFNERKLSWILHSYTTVGFNYIRYDLPLIWLAFVDQNIKKIKEASDAIILQNERPQQIEERYNFKIWPTDIIDLIEICPGNPVKVPGQFARPKNLKTYMGRLHSKRLQDLPFNPHEPLTQDQIDIVGNYCVNDLIGTEELYLHNKERIILREELGRELKTDLRSKSDAQMAEAMVAKEIRNITGKWPKKNILTPGTTFSYEPPAYLQFGTLKLQKLLSDVVNTQFVIDDVGRLSKPEIFKNYHANINDFHFKFGIGGLHSCEENISYSSNDIFSIIDRDVASYYPRIITSLRLYPEHLGDVFINVYDRMREERLEAKAQKLFTKEKGLKIALNGISGKFNSEYSVFYSPKCYTQMTLTGQLAILMLAEMFECQGIKVISANTDGIVSYCKNSDYEKMLYWISYWEKITDFVTEETQYKAYYGRDVNAYYALKTDGSIKVKGPYSEVGSQTGTKLDNNPICLICSDAVKTLLSKNIPIEQTIKECKDITRFVTVRNVASPGAHKEGNYLGKVVRWIYSKKATGTINYIATGNKVPETEGAWPVMDLPLEVPNHINHQWYIDKTIEILYDVGYLKRIEQEKLI